MFPLDIDKLSRERFRLFADFKRGKAAGFFDNFVFDGQSVTIPAGDKRRTFAEHRLRFHYKILEDLVQCRAHVDVAVREWWPVMQDK